MMPIKIQQMPLGQLIDQFNEPCDQGNCRFTSHRVDDDWCPRHRQLYAEIERRQQVFEAIPVA